MARDSSGSDTESLPDLDEFLASSFDPDLSDNEKEVGGQENADSLGLDLRAPCRFEPLWLGTHDDYSESETVITSL